MRAIELDFLHPAGRGSRLGPWLLVVGALVTLAAVSYRFISSMKSRRERRSCQTARHGGALGSGVVRAAINTPEVRDQIKKANAVLQQINVPWGELLPPSSRRKTAMSRCWRCSPTRSRTLLVGGEARDLPAALAYLGRLERTGRLRDVVLMLEVKARRQDNPSRSRSAQRGRRADERTGEHGRRTAWTVKRSLINLRWPGLVGLGLLLLTTGLTAVGICLRADGSMPWRRGRNDQRVWKPRSLHSGGRRAEPTVQLLCILPSD
jgi:hypothetical protein